MAKSNSDSRGKRGFRFPEMKPKNKVPKIKRVKAKPKIKLVKHESLKPWNIKYDANVEGRKKEFIEEKEAKKRGYYKIKY